MQEFTSTGTDERDAEEVAVVEIDHHPRPAGVAVGVKLGARYYFADLDVDHLYPMAGLLSLLR